MKTQEKKLKPCPFCGSENIVYGYREENASSMHGLDIYYIECRDCEAQIPYTICPFTEGSKTIEEIRKDLEKWWNTRV